MSRKPWFALLAVMWQSILSGVTQDQVQSVLDRQGRGACVYKSGLERPSFHDIFGTVWEDRGVESNQLFDILREYAVTVAATDGLITNRTEVLRLRRVLNILNDYDGFNSTDTFLRCATNCCDISVAYSSFRQYALNAGVDRAMDVLNTGIQGVPQERTLCIQGGAASAFDDHGGSTTQTNRMISLEMRNVLQLQNRWSESDGYICRWWPAYATSSNRYVAAQLAREANPPCASSNYLARVIAELEALPPGTMQMLSTNHLGQAWQE